MAVVHQWCFSVSFLTCVVVFLSAIGSVRSGEFTIELDDRDKQCFHQDFPKSEKEIILEFQVNPPCNLHSRLLLNHENKSFCVQNVYIHLIM